jgi:uncharacterized membrane protein YcaP (DUF421 family)
VLTSSFHFADPTRLFLGETPPVFLVEVAIRVVVLYGVLLLSLSLLGRRMSSRLTRNELLAIVSLSAAIGPAVQDPKQGLLPPVVAAALIVLVQRVSAWVTLRSERFERVIEGDASTLVADGRMQIEAMRSNGISRQRLFAQLRSKGLLNLGSVKRMYIEPNGAFCVLEAADAQPGLSLVPDWDPEFRAEQQFLQKRQVCFECGALANPECPARTCTHCRDGRWVSAVKV